MDAQGIRNLASDFVFCHICHHEPGYRRSLRKCGDLRLQPDLAISLFRQVISILPQNEG